METQLPSTESAACAWASRRWSCEAEVFWGFDGGCILKVRDRRGLPFYGEGRDWQHAAQALLEQEPRALLVRRVL